MKMKLVMVAILAAMSGAAFATGTGTEGATQGYDEQSMKLQSVDMNMDGVISEQEAQGNPQLVDRWDELDTNSDGQLDQDEFARFEMEGTGEVQGTESSGQ